jgi:transcriptional regulator with XRE-family HTH domain
MKQLLSEQTLTHENETPPEGLSVTQNIAVTSLEVRKVRKSLALTVENFGLLLGVSPSSIFRYENIGVNAFHQGPVARKLCLLSLWVGTDGQVAALRRLLVAPRGLAILAGLLEIGNVLTTNLSFDAYAGSLNDPNQKESKFPSVESLTNSILEAFRYPDTPMAQAKLEGPTNPNETASRVDDLASRVEAEARLMEAEARKLEAQARKLEAMARIKSVEGLATA